MGRITRDPSLHLRKDDIFRSSCPLWRIGENKEFLTPALLQVYRHQSVHHIRTKTTIKQVNIIGEGCESPQAPSMMAPMLMLTPSVTMQKERRVPDSHSLQASIQVARLSHTLKKIEMTVTFPAFFLRYLYY